MHLSFHRFQMRTKVLVISSLVVLISAGSIFGLLLTTGKLDLKADVITKNVTVTGKFIDSVTGAPVSNAKIIVGAGGRTPAQVLTKADGTYKAVLSINAAVPLQRTITIRQNNPGYPEGEGTVFTKLIRSDSSVSQNIIQDIRLSKIPIEADSTTLLDPISQRCRTPKPGPEDYSTWYHSGDYLGKEIHGVLFCARIDQRYNVEYPAFIEEASRNADQINYLVSQTGLSYTPVVYIVDEITWYKDAAAYVSSGRKEIIIDRNYLYRAITHEFGHLLDWDKGFDNSMTSKYTWCLENNGRTKRHCARSDSDDFINAFDLGSVGQEKDIEIGEYTLKGEIHTGGIYGYATTNYAEMFAEIFDFQFRPVGDFWTGEMIFLSREKFKYAIKNMMLAQYKYKGRLSGIITRTQEEMHEFGDTSSPDTHNAVMYLYKVVAKTGNIDQYFPGTVKSSWSYDQIGSGLYMDKAVVSLAAIDQIGALPGDGIKDVGGVVSDKSFQTRDYQTTGVFTDGTGDMFNKKGTEVLFNVSPGIDKIVDITAMPDGYSGAVYNKWKTKLVRGSNQVIDSKFSMRIINPIVYSPNPSNLSSNGISGKMALVDSGRAASPITVGQMLMHPNIGTLGGVVSDKFPSMVGKGLIFVLGGGNIRGKETDSDGNGLDQSNNSANNKITLSLFGSDGKSSSIFHNFFVCGPSDVSRPTIEPNVNKAFDCFDHITNKIEI